MRGLSHDAPILETNGGYGRIYERCYFDRPIGVVLEKEEDKALALARQRPTWRVYCANALPVLRAGIASDLPFAFIDLDPYGNAFEYLDALFLPGRRFADRVQLVVNDGYRQKTRIRSEWQTPWMAPIVDKYGVGVREFYLEVCRELVESRVSRVGFEVAHWVGWYCGMNDDMTHYWATLERRS